MNIFGNTKIFTEYNFLWIKKMFLWISKFFSEYKNMNFAPNEQRYIKAWVILLSNAAIERYYGKLVFCKFRKG